jgi:exopolyphosphatase/guanosine-5'-triphosphate,3'-diphosphate pyrophosphatase
VVVAGTVRPVTRVAAIDCGTNSLRLLIADVDPVTGELVDIDRRMEIVRLGQGVDRTGRLDPAAIARTLAVTGDYALWCRQAGVERVRFVATSATRDASNRDEFTAGVRALLGVEPEVIDGAQEAALSFRGATATLAGTASVGPPYLVVDIGGGSTEFVLGATGGEDLPLTGLSVDVGCVRLTERHLHGDPPRPEEVAAARADVRAALDRVAHAVPLGATATLVGLAGSVTTVTAHALGLRAYDASRIHGARLRVPQVLAACADLLARDRAGRAGLPFMHPGRVDVIGAGALIWAEVVSRVSREAGLDEVMTSEHDILDGIALELAGPAGAPPCAGTAAG